MSRPIPLFRFVFAAYFATLDGESDEPRRDGAASAHPARPDGSHLALVVDNGSVAPSPAHENPAERNLECTIDG